MSGSTHLTPERHLELLDRESTRFAEVLADVPPKERVPTCPEWHADDLLYHLGQVQDFWASVVANRIRSAEEAQAVERLPRTDDREALSTAARGARARLLEALSSADDDVPVWTWAPQDQNVAFVRRRQTHEACIHRLDAELTAAADGGMRTPIDPMLAADGVDEVLRLVAETLPPDAQVERDEGRVIRVVASDTGNTWLVTMTRVVVTEDGRPKAHQGIAVADVDPADGTVRPAAILAGTAEDLDCTLWARPALGALHRTGDLRLLEEFTSAIAQRLGG